MFQPAPDPLTLLEIQMPEPIPIIPKQVIGKTRSIIHRRPNL